MGAIISAGAKDKSMLAKHLEKKQTRVLKFYAFINKNCYFPFWVKRFLAFLAGVFHGSESWYSDSKLITTQTVYFELPKSLLSVRTSTCNDLVLLEIYNPLLKTG